MQAKKSKQLLKARLLRERQIYDMRKRAELRAAVSELEKPWELVQQAPALFSVAADEQVKTLADRFQRPGGFDMWSDRDGPQILRRGSRGELVPSERFFPKGVVHSVRPYGVVGGGGGGGGGDWIARGGGGVSSRSRRRGKEECGEGVRGNADERGGGDSGVIDVQARLVNEDRRRVGGNANANADANEGRGRGRGGGGRWNNAERVRGNSETGNNRERVGGIRRSVRGNNGERVGLRASSELSDGGGRSRVRELGRNK